MIRCHQKDKVVIMELTELDLSDQNHQFIGHLLRKVEYLNQMVIGSINMERSTITLSKLKDLVPSHHQVEIELDIIKKTHLNPSKRLQRRRALPKQQNLMVNATQKFQIIAHRTKIDQENFHQ